jgi:hypothetical protein
VVAFSFGSFLFCHDSKREKNGVASFGREAGSRSVPSVFTMDINNEFKNRWAPGFFGRFFGIKKACKE